eukprot:jgi/Mesvir1/24621/Mv21933-RA.3
MVCVFSVIHAHAHGPIPAGSGLLHRATHGDAEREVPKRPAGLTLVARPPAKAAGPASAGTTTHAACGRAPAPFVTLMKERAADVPWEGLTDRMLLLSRANTGSNYRLQHAIHKLQQGQGVKIAVAGGSVAFGYGCDGDQAGEQALVRGRAQPWDCAWSAKLEEWLHAAYPSTPRDRIQVVNMAKPSTTTQWAATFLSGFAEHLGHPLSDFDIFFIDYEINDERSGPPDEVKKLIPASAEQLLIKLLSLPQQPAVVFLFTGNLNLNALTAVAGPDDPKYLLARPWIEDEEMKVLRYYQIPALSWRDAFWHNAFLPDGTRNPLMKCQDDKHPSGCLHAVWAALVANLLVDEVDLYCREKHQKLAPTLATNSGDALWHSATFQSPRYTLPSGRLLKGGFKEMQGEVFSSALTTLTVDHGQDKFVPSEVAPKGSWQFREDVPGKPGWIIEGPGGGEEISFDVLFSRRIVLGFMSSYENMGQVQVFVDKLQPAPGAALPSEPTTEPGQLIVVKQAEAPANVVDSLWRIQASQYTQKTVLYLSVPKKPPIWVRVRLRRMNAKKVQSRLGSRGNNKFKLLAVISD